ncbi:MHYT domain-containing protein [Nonomuraea rhodomycinica]|uniref:MHYT domain-containing protein n=1 Tax=Nonomuraea rhodomycinica TaxID=1712872 RepID=UPI001FE7B0DA|nr:MHYT domain-containing protein [Nonomuraea rhodomycinica]
MSSAVNHFTHGLITPVLAYVMSCMGSMLGLRLTVQARASRGASRMRWLLGAAVSIGGTGIWVMHFIAMMGFQVEGTQIRFDVPLTAASAAVAIVVVGTGLFLVSYGRGRVLALLGGGLLTGLGVASMHYLGMYAMNMSAHVSYDRITVIASVVIAVVAATAALWFTLRVTRPVWIFAAALIMGVAVSGMHYTGMYALRVTVDPEPGVVPGADALDFLVPLMTVISLITLTMLLMVILSPSEQEMSEDAELTRRLELRRRNRQQLTETPLAEAAPLATGGRPQRGPVLAAPVPGQPFAPDASVPGAPGAFTPGAQRAPYSGQPYPDGRAAPGQNAPVIPFPGAQHQQGGQAPDPQQQQSGKRSRSRRR